jgi:hypothetical protein
MECMIGPQPDGLNKGIAMGPRLVGILFIGLFCFTVALNHETKFATKWVLPNCSGSGAG